MQFNLEELSKIKNDITRSLVSNDVQISYKLIQFQLINSGDVIDIITYNVKQILINKPYVTGHSYPEISVGFKIRYQDYAKMIGFTGPIEANIHIMELRNSSMEGKEEIYGEDIVNDKFTAILMPYSPNIDKAKLEDDGLNKDDNQNDEGDYVDLNVRLIKTEKLTSHGFTFGGLVSGSALGVVQYCIGESDMTNVVMSLPDNNPTLTNVLIPTMNTIDILKYMQETVGLYNSPIYYFIDFDRTYILKLGESNATIDNDYSLVFRENASLETFSNRIEFNRTVITAPINKMDLFLDINPLGNEYGTNIVNTYNNDTMTTTNHTDKSHSVSGHDLGKSLHMNYDNPSLIKAMNYDDFSKKNFISLSLKDFPFYSIKPNNKIKINSQYVNGYYMPRAAELHLLKRYQDIFHSMTKISLYDISE